MDPEPLVVFGVLAGTTTLVAAVLGYVSERSALGVVFLAVFTAIACGTCIAGFALGEWIGLGIAVVLVVFPAWRIGSGLGHERGAALVPALWLGYCGSCAVGYWAAGWLGLLTITLPGWIVFWGGMYAVSRHLLPLEGKKQWSKAFRSLFTFSLGTNYPYHVQEDGELVQRISGNPYGRLFAGPGIVLTDAAHAPIVWDGLKFRRIAEPGLTLTERLETIHQVVDLRPQLRTFQIEALTKDGIRVRVQTFLSFKLQSRDQEPRIGSSFPLDRPSIYKAVWTQPVEHGQRRLWDEMVPIAATRIMRRIIAGYDFDELCALHDPRQDPRVEINERLAREVREDVQKYGIEVIGSRIGDLLPADLNIINDRIMSWRAQWERKIMEVLGQGRANALLQTERAHARAQAEMIDAIGGIIEQPDAVDPSVVTDMAALRFIEALEEMTCRPEVQDALPGEVAETMAYMRRALTRGSA
jgi:hypothetical protein